MKTKLTKADVSASSSYPLVNLAVNLSAAAYAGTPAQVVNAVEAAGASIVWGPAESIHNGISDSLMFVAIDTIGAYWVTIRGTNEDSIYSWLNEDVDIHNLVPFSNYVSAAPVDAAISQATANGLDLLLGLTDPDSGQTMLSFLSGLGGGLTFVTGHSLGGTLVPPLYAIIYDQVFGSSNTSLGYFSFAGLTSGNYVFADYFNTINPANGTTDMRVVNPLDIAPDCWGDYILLTEIYDAFGLPWSSVPESARAIIDGLFLSGALDLYVQPANPTVLPANFNGSDQDWISQAAYQHHISTYQALVAQKFPLQA
ncbi:MAG: hypothetical protein U0176_16615 [Bacteroidia bacterium]